MANITKCVRQLTFLVQEGIVNYLDIASALSIVNRKLFDQGMCYGIESVEYSYLADPLTVDTTQLIVRTAGDSWPVHNGWVKSKAMWDQMQALVLEDNPSIAGKWHDYKVYLDGAHQQAAVVAPGINLPLTGDLVTPYSFTNGEWNYSTFVLPEHSVDAAGNPLAADECYMHLIGEDVPGAAGTLESAGIVKAYGLSRATVQDSAPNVPASFGTSFFNVLTDSGSQEPELADVIEDENDQPPYNPDAYPGGATNALSPNVTDIVYATLGSPEGRSRPFVAQCGLLSLEPQFYLAGEVAAYTAPMLVTVNLMAGSYKGVAAVRMGQ